MTEPYRGLILGAFPKESWQDVVNYVEEGVATADREIANNPLLTWPVGRDQRGDLRRVGVMRSLRDACTRRELPLTFGADPEGRVTHVCIGMPCDRGNRWLDRINLLTELRLTGIPPIVTPKQAPAEPPAKPVFGLKAEVRKDLEKQGEKNNGRKDESDGSNG